MTWQRALAAAAAAAAVSSTSNARVTASSASSSSLPRSVAGKGAHFRRVALACVVRARTRDQLAQQLAELRQLRWTLLQHTAPGVRPRLLEAMLCVYAEATWRACSRHAYSRSSGSSSSSGRDDDGIEQCMLQEQVQCLVEAKVAGLPLAAQHVRHVLQFPALARVSPQLPLLLLHELTTMTPQQRCDADDSSSSNNDDDDDSSSSADSRAARDDCAVGLACAGQTSLALQLCSGRTFVDVLRRIAQQPRGGGWAVAWAMAQAVPRTRLLQEQDEEQQQQQQGQHTEDAMTTTTRAATAMQHGWLWGVLCAAREYVRASEDRAATAAVVTAWLRELMQCYNSTTTTAAAAAATSAASDAVPLTRCVPVALVDCYVAICPTSEWRSALSVYEQCYYSNNSTSGGVAPLQPQLSRLLMLLQHAAQPRCVLRLLYGTDDVAVLHERTRQQQQQQQQRDDDGGEHNDDDNNNNSCTLPPITQLTSPHLSMRMRQSTALYNRALAALAAVRLWRGALQLYTAMTSIHGLAVAVDEAGDDAAAVCCRVRSNMHTHLCLLRAVLQLSSSSSSSLQQQQCDDGEVDAEAAYAACGHALDALMQLSSRLHRSDKDSGDDNNVDDNNNDDSSSSTAAVVIPATHPVREELLTMTELYMLWTALRYSGGGGSDDVGATVTAADVLRRARAVPPGVCRYAHLIALAVAIRSNDVAAVRWLLCAVCNDNDNVDSSSDSSSGETTSAAATAAVTASVQSCALQQLCLAVAFVANSAVAMRACTYDSDVDNERSDDGSKAREPHALAPPLHNMLLRSLSRHVAHSQHVTNTAIELLASYFVRVQQQQQQQHATRHKDKATVTRPHGWPPPPQRVFAYMLTLMRGTTPYADAWFVLLTLLTQLTQQHNMSLAHAAPALVAAGVSGDIALHFLPP